MADPPEIQALHKLLDEIWANQRAISDKLDMHARQTRAVSDQISRLTYAAQPFNPMNNYAGIKMEERLTWPKKVPALKQELQKLKVQQDLDMQRLLRELRNKSASRMPSAHPPQPRGR